MTARRRYRKRSASTVVAVQLALDTEGFTYRKWGGMQTCKPGDWIVHNAGDVYTVDQETFARTYSAAGAGQYRKTATVWAEVADRDGAIDTREGVTHYAAGAYLVFNDEEGRDGYAVTPESFEAMYEPID